MKIRYLLVLMAGALAVRLSGALPPPIQGGSVEIGFSFGNQTVTQIVDYLPSGAGNASAAFVSQTIAHSVSGGANVTTSPRRLEMTYALDPEFIGSNQFLVRPTDMAHEDYLGSGSFNYKFTSMSLVMQENPEGNSAAYTLNISFDKYEADNVWYAHTATLAGNTSVSGFSAQNLFGRDFASIDNGLFYDAAGVTTLSSAAVGDGFFTTYYVSYVNANGTTVNFDKVYPAQVNCYQAAPPSGSGSSSTPVYHRSFYDLEHSVYIPIGTVHRSLTGGTTVTPIPLTPEGALAQLRAADWTFADVFTSESPVDATYDHNDGEVAATKTAYKIIVHPGSTQSVHWLETFTPTGAIAPTHRKLMSWTPQNGATESGVYFLDPLEASNPDRFPGQTGRYALELVQAELAVDANRDGIIHLQNEDDTDRVTAPTPYRFWINDDNDQGPTEGDDIPERPFSKCDCNNLIVDSVRDLIDFFPIFFDIKEIIQVLPPSDSVKYKLKQADEALNFIYTNIKREEAFDFQKKILVTGFGPTFNQAAGEATIQRITATGVELNTTFLNGIKNDDLGVVLIEGCVVSDMPLRLVVEENGAQIAEVTFDIKISSVEDMFRHINLTSFAKNYDGSLPSLPETPLNTRTVAPVNWPDTLTNGKYFVFVHGYNVDAQKARGWNCEVFKRLHVLGSNTRFVGVTWHGATGLDYHKAVYQAFQTGDVLADQLSFTGNADVTIAAHSLGNMVVSHAIQSGGFTPTRYYMVNAATPIESYAVGDAGQNEEANMTELAWRGHDPRLYMANWHKLFAGTSDVRKNLTWKNFFSSVRTRTDTHNFYSEGEDVVADADQNTSASIVATLLNQGVDVSTGAWKAQELVKGVNWSTSLAALFMERGQAGWSFNPNWYKERGRTNSGPIVSVRFPSEAGEAEVPTASLKTKPFFGAFLEPSLISSNAPTAAVKAEDKKVKYDLFARGIPAMSNAVAANAMTSLDPKNYAMHLFGKVARNGAFPSNSRGDWRHSDFKAVALPYVYPMYEEMILRGALK